MSNDKNESKNLDADIVISRIINYIENCHLKAIRGQKRISPELDESFNDMIINIKSEINTYRERNNIGVLLDMQYNRCKKCGVLISTSVYLCQGCWGKD